MSSQNQQNPTEEQPKKSMSAGNIVLLVIGILLILGGGYYYYKTIRQPSVPAVASSSAGSMDGGRAVLDAAGTIQDINLLRGFSYYF